VMSMAGIEGSCSVLKATKPSHFLVHVSFVA